MVNYIQTHWKFDSSTTFQLIQKATCAQMENTISAISINWSSSKSSVPGDDLPPLIVRKDGSLSTLLEVCGVQHLENTLSMIQVKKYLRDNIILYLTLREEAVKDEGWNESRSLKNRDSQERTERVRYIEMNQFRFGEAFESGMTDYFHSSREKIVRLNDEGPSLFASTQESVD